MTKYQLYFNHFLKFVKNFLNYLRNRGIFAKKYIKKQLKIVKKQIAVAHSALVGWRSQFKSPFKLAITKTKKHGKNLLTVFCLAGVERFAS